MKKHYFTTLAVSAAILFSLTIFARFAVFRFSAVRLFQAFAIIVGIPSVCTLVIIKRTRPVGILLASIAAGIIVWALLDRSGSIGGWPTGLN